MPWGRWQPPWAPRAKASTASSRRGARARTSCSTPTPTPTLPLTLTRCARKDELLYPYPTPTLPLTLTRCARKDELLELCAKAEAGVGRLDEAEQARFDELLLRELPALNPTPQPTQSSRFTGTWECRWTDEKELNFAVANGLFGLPWLRTYQEIDISASSLVNVLEFEGVAFLSS